VAELVEQEARGLGDRGVDVLDVVRGDRAWRERRPHARLRPLVELPQPDDDAADRDRALEDVARAADRLRRVGAERLQLDRVVRGIGDDRGPAVRDQVVVLERQERDRVDRRRGAEPTPSIATGARSTPAVAARASRCDRPAQLAKCARVAGPTCAKNVSASFARRAAASIVTAGGRAIARHV
jgi:hypothetical protein